LIELKGIGRSFQVGTEAVHALQAVDLTVRGGEYLSVMGPSGSGKSTLLNIIGLLDRPDSGLYRLDDVNATELNDTQQAAVRRHKIGFVFQFFHLVPRLTAEQNVELPLVLAGVDKTERKKRVLETLESFGIGDRVHHRPDQLSGGQRQRVAIARATIMKPTVILADEPTGNLDRASGNDVVDILEELNSQGITLIMVTHDPELGERAKRRIKMVDGRIEGATATQS
jgi:putative ABC transport system ATP-binding protein